MEDMKRAVSITAGDVTFHIPDYNRLCSVSEDDRWPISPGLPKHIYYKRRKLASMKHTLKCWYLGKDVVKQAR
jgi:hypothetical protein